MSKIAIVAALEREVRPLVKGWRVSERQHSGRNFRFFETEEAVLVCGGIGAEAARRAAEAVIVLYQPGIVYSVGYAGSLDPAIGVGEIVRPARIIDTRDGSSIAIAGGEGVLVTAGGVAGPAQKRVLRDSFAAQAVDMEASAVARAAQARGIDFGVVKAISDAFDFALPANDRFVDSRGRFMEMRFATYVAVRPWLWRRVIKLGHNSRLATKALCRALRELLDNRVLAPFAHSQTSKTEAR